MTLTEFLLARIAEDEAVARDPRWLAFEYGVDGDGRAAFSARVLAECEAKRQIVEGHGADGHWCPMGDGTLRALALPYADHPDYNPDWRP